MPDQIDDTWADITEKQREAIGLVAEGYTTKEAARQLDITPKVFDRRIEAVRRKCGGVTRGEAVRLFLAHERWGEKHPHGRTPLTPLPTGDAARAQRHEGEQIAFARATFEEPAPWEDLKLGSLPEIEPSRLGRKHRLILVGIVATLLAAATLLVIGIASGVQDLMNG